MIRLSDVHILKVDPKLGITSEHIKGLAESYATSGVRAPVVVGHPKDNSPAWGWVLSCREDNDNLFCDIELSPEFFDLVKKGHYTERSVAFYNRKPYVLRHLGFLGGTPPAIKGLQELTFSDDDDYKCIAMTIEETKKSNPKDYLAPVALYTLSEVLPGVKASNLIQDPVFADGQLSGIVELSDGQRYGYTIVENNGAWEADTKLLNPEVVTLSEKVANLERQLTIQENIAKVDKLYDSNKLTEAILPRKDCMALVTCSESDTVWKLLNNLPVLVEDTPVPESKTPADITLAENDLHAQVVAKATELKLDPRNPQDYTQAFIALS